MVNGTTVIECTLVQGRVTATHPLQQHLPHATNDGAIKRVAAKHTAMPPMRVAATHPGINGQWSSVGATPCDMRLEVTSINVVQTTAEMGPHPTCYMQCQVEGVHPYL